DVQIEGTQAVPQSGMDGGLKREGGQHRVAPAPVRVVPTAKHGVADRQHQAQRRIGHRGAGAASAEQSRQRRFAKATLDRTVIAETTACFNRSEIRAQSRQRRWRRADEWKQSFLLVALGFLVNRKPAGSEPTRNPGKI